MKRLTGFLAALLLVTGCTHKYESEAAKEMPFDPSLVINEPVILKNAYTEEGKLMYEAFRDSKYFPQLYREDDAPPAGTRIALDAKLEKENSSNGLQKTGAFISAITLTAVPAYVSWEYTLNVGLYDNGKFYKRYKANIEKSNVVVALNAVRESEISLAKQVLPEVLKQIKTDFPGVQ